ncbi:MAG: hypothetical protein AB1529_06700 [Candidatus Micrarchaeota archaeon]
MKLYRKERLGEEKRGDDGRRKLLGAALLGGGLALGGCGDSIYNYYYTGPDGGAKNADSAPKSDSPVADSLAADACISNAKIRSCTDAVIVAGFVNQGESLVIPSPTGAGNFKLALDDGQVLDGKNYAVVSLLDDCGNILMKSKIGEGSTKKLVLDGRTLEVTVEEAAFGLTFGAKWANFTVKAPCEDATQYWCPAVAGILNQGESIAVDNLKFQLDDLATTGGINSAIISVLDANGAILTKTKVAEGTSVEVSFAGKLYLLTVKSVAPGYTFGAKWADIEISGKADKPCGSP